MKPLYLHGAASVLLLSLSACNFKEDKTSDSPTTIGDGTTTTELRFADVKAQVFDQSCSCHVASNQGGVSLKTYAATLSAIQSRDLRNVTLVEKRMPYPPDALSDGQQALLKEWLDGGAPE